jgi:hypothetical protein
MYVSTLRLLLVPCPFRRSGLWRWCGRLHIYLFIFTTGSLSVARWEIIFETARGEIVSWRSPSLFTMGMLFYLFDRGRDVDDQLKFRLERKSVPAADGQRRAPS